MSSPFVFDLLFTARLEQILALSYVLSWQHQHMQPSNGRDVMCYQQMFYCDQGWLSQVKQAKVSFVNHECVE